MIMVRPYRESDLAGMLALNVRAMSDAETAGPAHDGMTRDLQITFERKLGFWVATESENDSEVVGMIALRTPDDDAPPASVGGGRRVSEVVSFRVSPDHQRKGIGTLLINAVVDWSRQGAYDAVIVNATPDRVAAMGVYRSLGFYQVPSTFRGAREILWFELPLDRDGPSR
jgi:ribosomal protein S18 acetylase RimI-like enzyme